MLKHLISHSFKILAAIILICSMRVGIVFAESAAQDAIPFRMRPINQWQATNCLKVCAQAPIKNQADCRVQCTTILTCINKVEQDLNGTNAVFWFNQTNDYGNF